MKRPTIMKLSLGLVLSATAVLCAAQEPLVQPAVGPNDLSFAQLEVGLDSPIKKSGVRVIRTQKDWDEFLVKMNEKSVKRPKVDFDKFQIVVATLEGSANNGTTLRVAKVQKAKNGKVNIEVALDPQTGNSRLIDTTNSNNYLGQTRYPYAIIQTSKIDTKWDIKVSE